MEGCSEEKDIHNTSTTNLDGEVAPEKIWSLWLTFRRRDVEEAYRVEHRKTIAAYAGTLHNYSSIFGILVFVLMLVFDNMAFSERMLGLMNNVVLPGIGVYLWHHHNAFFAKWYDVIEILLEVIVVPSVAYRTVLRVPQSSHPVFILATWSPLPALFIIGISFNTTFWAQVPGQFLSMVLSWYWTQEMCKLDNAAHPLLNGMEAFAKQMEASTTSLFMTMPGGGRQRDNCAVIFGWIHFAIGFILPCALKYVLESLKRANYLAMRCNPRSHQLIRHHFVSNLIFVAYLTPLSLILFWYCMDTWVYFNSI